MLSGDRNTPYKDGDLVAVPLAAAAVAYAGGLAVINASGFGAAGTTATGLAYFGRFEEHVDNSEGANGEKHALVRRGKAFKWENSSGDPVTQASLGRTCYIEDDETVSGTDGSGTQSACGTVIQINEDGVWVA